MNVLLKEREVGFYLEDSGAKLLLAWHGFAEAAEAGAAAAGAECVLVDPAEFDELLGSAEPSRRGRRARRRRHRGDPLHVGHDRHAEGRRAHARQPDDATPRLSARRCSRSRQDDVDLRRRCRCSTSSARPAGSTPRSRAGATLTLLPRFDPTQGARDHRARPGDGLRGRADDVRRAAQPPGPRRLRRHALRVCVSGGAAHAGRGAARLRGGLRLQGPRGLRAVGDLAGRVVQPPRPRAQARLDRHADRGRRDEGRRRRRQRGRRRARSARS